MIAIFLSIGVAALCLIGATSAASSGRDSRPAPSPSPGFEDPIELAERDPVDALLRYGTPETADQLRAQGVDPAALGYRDGDG